MYNLFLITLTFGVFICLQVILYQINHLLFIDVLCIHTHILRLPMTQGSWRPQQRMYNISSKFLSNYEQ
jgi:uncharacterized membrane protein